MVPLKEARVYVTGRGGLVGSSLVRALKMRGVGEVLGHSSSDLDLRDRDATFDAIDEARPDVVINAAARVGGILANSSEPADFLRDNILIQTNVLDAAHAAGVDRLVFLSSNCVYPRAAAQPIPEEALLAGPPEPTNRAYALAKIAGMELTSAYRRQFGRRWISLVPASLYGPGDNYDRQSSHLAAALIRRFHEAVRGDAPSITLWGSGEPRRELMHVDDFAAACLFLLEAYDDERPINIGPGSDVSVRELASLVAEIAGFSGEVNWDPSKPDGTLRKLLDSSRMRGLGWSPRIPLEDGLRSTFEAYSTTVGAGSLG